MTTAKKARVILFKLSGKFYTEENWRIPETVKDRSDHRGDYVRTVLGPFDMKHSPDFRRIDGGAVLVETQEPWGYPHLFPSEATGVTEGLRNLALAARAFTDEMDKL